MIAGAEHAPAKGPELARQMLLCRERRVRCCKRKCKDNYGPVAHHSSPCKEDGYNVLISYPLLTAPRRSSPGRDWTDAVLLPNDVLWDYYRRVLCGVSVSNKRVTQPSELCGQAWKSQPHMSEKSPIYPRPRVSYASPGRSVLPRLRGLASPMLAPVLILKGVAENFHTRRGINRD